MGNLSRKNEKLHLTSVEGKNTFRHEYTRGLRACVWCLCFVANVALVSIASRIFCAKPEASTWNSIGCVSSVFYHDVLHICQNIIDQALWHTFLHSNETQHKRKDGCLSCVSGWLFRVLFSSVSCVGDIQCTGPEISRDECGELIVAPNLTVKTARLVSNSVWTAFFSAWRDSNAVHPQRVWTHRPAPNTNIKLKQ